MARTRKSPATSSSGTVALRRVALRSMPRANGSVILPTALTEAKLGGKPTQSDLWRSRYGRALDLNVIENSLRAADWGSMRMLTDLSRETIDVDPHLASVLNKRINSLASLPWEVRPAEGPGLDPERALFYAEVVRDQLNRLPEFRQGIAQLSWALFDGRAAHEIVWANMQTLPGFPVLTHPKFGTVRWAARSLEWIHPRRLHFGPERELRVCDDLVDTGFKTTGVALRDLPGKFIQWTPQMFGDYQEREGLARRCLYWSFFKRFAARERMILLELFGKPWRWLEVDEESSAGREDLEAADSMLDGVGGNTGFRFPRGTKFQVTQPAAGAGAVHNDTVAESDRQLSKLVLGQTGTTDGMSGGGLNSNQAGVMQAEQYMLLGVDAAMQSEAWETYLTDAIIELNFGTAALDHAPIFVLRSDIPADRTKELARLDAAIKAGLEISVAEAYEVSGFRRPKKDEAVIKLETPPVHPMAVQPNPERPIIVYPTSATLPERQVMPVSPVAPGGLQPPTEKAIEGGGLYVDPPTAAQPAEETPIDVSLPVTAARAKAAKRGGDERAAVEALLELAGHSDAERERIMSAYDTDVTAVSASLAFAHPRDAAISRLTLARIHLAAVGRTEAALAAGTFDVDAEVAQAKQPEEAVIGSIETLIEKGVKEGAKELGAIANHFINAIGELSDAGAIASAIDRAGETVDLHPLIRSLERRILQSAMAGAIAGSYESESGAIVDPTDTADWPAPEEGEAAEEVTATRRMRLAVGETPPVDPNFVARPLADAVKWFREKAIVTRSVFDRLEAAAKRRAFTVANMLSELMIQRTKDELEARVRDGGQVRDFKRFAEERLVSAGFVPANPSHVETVYRTNVLSAYSSGRHAQMTQPEVIRQRPYWQIRTVNDGPPRQRSTHQAVHEWVLSADDAFWQRAFPPFGFNCRCRVVSLSPADVKERELRVRSGGEISGLPDPGFTSGPSTLL